MDRRSIETLRDGEKINEIYLIKESACRLTNGSNNKFLDINLIDRTGNINAKLWKCSDDDIENFKENNLVRIKGNVLDWKGKLQIKIDSYQVVTDIENHDMDMFVPTAPFKPNKMVEYIKVELDNFKNEDLKKIVTHVLDENMEELLYYPAAKSNHHAVKGGLLYHIITMMRAGKRMCEVYNFLNRDLLLAGVVLHDICKIYEMKSSKLGIVNEYSIEGQLLGHITMGVRYIERLSRDLEIDSEISMLLQHMILSHHYEAEYGSPKKPMTPEAEMLHFLDIMDARMYDMQKAVSGLDEGTFSEKIFSLDGICVYNSKLKK